MYGIILVTYHLTY